MSAAGCGPNHSPSPQENLQCVYFSTYFLFYLLLLNIVCAKMQGVP